MLDENGKMLETIQILNHPRCECGGEFKYLGISEELREDKYKYACDKCRKRRYFKNIYPQSIYVDIELKNNKEGKENAKS